MPATLRHKITGLTICAVLAIVAIRPAMADHPRPENRIPTSGDIVWIGVGIAAIGAGIAIGIVLAVGHHNHNITGCVATGPNGLQLLSDNDQQTYALIGNTADIRAGDRVRVSARRQKTGVAEPRILAVDKLGKDFGSCTASPAHP
jgi:hypothetical protein